ncbi:MAG: pyridoxal 5'-phosphate synthase [Planctomycetota bacterium]|nr:pyridoxal 5'-phosphate synthase [Planctomycetota bacterium]
MGRLYDVPGLPRELIEAFCASPELPDPLPADPFGLLREWFDDERRAKRTPNPDAMSLATVTAAGEVSNRIVLCRGMDVAGGFVTFFTNRQGAKGRALAETGKAAACFHWDASDRQARLEGLVTLSPDDESDAYFASRRWESRLSAWTSNQSEPTPGRGALLARMAGVIASLGLTPENLMALRERAPIPRPAHWGGYRLHATRVELWLGGTGRLHDRASWTRDVEIVADRVIRAGGWRSTRLQP